MIFEVDLIIWRGGFGRRQLGFAIEVIDQVQKAIRRGQGCRQGTGDRADAAIQ